MLIYEFLCDWGIFCAYIPSLLLAQSHIYDNVMHTFNSHSLLGYDETDDVSTVAKVSFSLVQLSLLCKGYIIDFYTDFYIDKGSSSDVKLQYISVQSTLACSL